MKHRLFVVCLAVLAACTAPPPNAEGDPFEQQDPAKPVNEVVFGFNLVADEYALKPVADVYHETPELVRTGVSNFLSNLHEPANFANALLQLNLENAGISFWRFAFNSTLGVAGFYDFSTDHGIHRKDTTFSKTLGRYDVADGAYMVLPVAGPSTVRDTAGFAVDWFLDPVGWFLPKPVSITQGVLDGVVAREDGDALIDQLYYKSLDPYTATRAAYLQHQAFQ